MSKRSIIILLILTILLFISNLFWGSVSVPIDESFNILIGRETGNKMWEHIILQSRLPQAVTATLAGAALAVAGLLLQTAFSNPLAGPSILGITSGASLGVAVVMLVSGGAIGGISGSISTVGGAFVGSLITLGIIILFSMMVRSNVMLLIVGIMVGYVANSAITLLNFFASEKNVFSYTLWGMGDFSSVSISDLPTFAVISLLGIVLSLLLIKPLNALLLGDRYAANLGVNVKLTRILLLLCTGLLTAIVTSYCGPISFLGLAVPHVARLLSRSSNHHTLLPVTLLVGSATALLCTLICSMPWQSGVLPLNAITPIFGAPVIIYVIINRSKIEYFN
ncbi:MAG: iron ABC transporter permease [Bacteroidales bacterium]|nr:iron ABC transporter permease [Bacteroidales bacterium]MBQ7818134.1 iron ABC transporter permease [Bacteroidales bacterium]